MKKLFLVISVFIGLLLTNIDCQAQKVGGELGNLAAIKKGFRNRRISSTDKNGNNGDWIDSIKPGEKWSVAISGTGIINHIWFTISPMNIMRNNLIFRIYWDGKSYPSVEAPLAAFFGNGWDEYYEFASLPLAVGPQGGTGLVSYFQMPFANGARLEIENQSDETISRLYFYIDYVEMKKLPNDLGRFHAWYNHELTDALPEGETEWGLVGPQINNVDGAGNYLFADIKGEGQFVGINYYVHSPSPMWYGEGDDMIFIDGEEKASLLGTGTEDFFNTSWCPKTIFIHPYYGYARVNNDNGWLGRTHVYRFFISDPIYFEKSLKGTIEHGHNNNLTLDISSVAYWYQSEAGILPPAPPKADRTPKEFIRDQDMHRWRHEWRKNSGNGSKLWGNEVNEKPNT
ncbi:MAG: glycoside hydrolase family 172 protein [Bacteroides cellulosilyticus]